MEEKGAVTPKGTPMEGEGNPKTTPTVSRVPTRPRVTLTLTTSPPRSGEEPARNVSVMNLQWDDDSGRSIKRVRRDSSPGVSETDASPSTESMMRRSYRESVYKLDKESRNLLKLVRENSNTKKEIKESAKCIRSIMSYITTSDMQALVSPTYPGHTQHDEELNALKEELRLLRQNWDSEKKEEDTTLTVVNCKACLDATARANKEKREAEKIINRFGNGEDLSVFKEIAEAAWPEGAYQTVKVAVGTANRVARDRDSFRLIDEEYRPLDTPNSREMTELRGQGLTPGKVGLKIHITETPSANGAMQRTERHLYYGMVGEDKLETTHKALLKLGSMAEGKNRRRLAVELPGIDPNTARKLTQFSLQMIKGDILLLSQKAGHPNQGNTVAERSGEEKKRTPTTTGARAKSGCTVVVKSQGRTYAELLKDVKSQTMGELGNATVTQVWKNATGDLEMRTKNEKDAAVVKQVIAGRIKDSQVAIKEKKVILHVRDMENSTTKEEIQTSLAKVAGIPEDYDVTSVRPAFGDTLAATIKAGEARAKALLEAGRIRIGLVSCRIRERTETAECRKCWSRAHLTKDCKGPDYSRRCRKCGKEGHFAYRCPSEMAACITCGTTGHRTASTNCPKIVEKMTGNKQAQA